MSSTLPAKWSKKSARLTEDISSSLKGKFMNNDGGTKKKGSNSDAGPSETGDRPNIENELVFTLDEVQTILARVAIPDVDPSTVDTGLAALLARVGYEMVTTSGYQRLHLKKRKIL